MGGKKKFTNGTDMDLSIDLTVRKGSNPGNTLKTVSVSLGDGDSEMVQYGNDENPYLNGIVINGVENGELIATQDFTFKRGNKIDDDFNTHDTVVVKRDHDTFDLHFDNTWTV